MRGLFSILPYSRIAKHLIRKVLFFAILTIILFIIITGLITWFKETKEIENKFDEIQNSYSDLIRETLWVDDNDSLKIILLGICRLPGIRYADIHSKDFQICNAGNKPSSIKLTRKFSIVHTYNDKIHTLGVLHIVGDLNYVKKDIQGNIGHDFITNVYNTYYLHCDSLPNLSYSDRAFIKNNELYICLIFGFNRHTIGI